MSAQRCERRASYMGNGTREAWGIAIAFPVTPLPRGGPANPCWVLLGQRALNTAFVFADVVSFLTSRTKFDHPHW